jgi:hypothetical protein
VGGSVSGNLRLYGTSGYVELQAPANAVSQTLILPTDSIQPALVHINTTTFSAVSSVSVDNCFTSDYENYRVLINAQTASGLAAFYTRLRASGVDATTANYDITGIYVQTNGATGANACAIGATSGQLQGIASTASSYTMDIMTPYLAKRTFTMGQWLYGQYFGSNSNMHTLANSYDGFTIYPASSTITGTIRVYGYRNGA